MARVIYVNGETMVYVKGRSDSAIAALSELGLADSPIRITPEFRFLDVNVDAWGQQPADVQWMLASMSVDMTLVQFDRAVLETCVALSMGGAPAIGQMGRAGQLMGNGLARFAPATANPSTGYSAGNSYIGLNLSSPVAGVPWRFYYTYLSQPPFVWPLGAERSLVQLSWRVVPYVADPYNGGLGAYAYQLYDHTLDN